MTVVPGALTPDQVSKFHRDGYLVIPHFFDAAPILREAQSVIDTFDPVGHPMTKFSTGSGDGEEKDVDSTEEQHVGDRYFLESGDQIRYFLEEGAVDSKGQLTRPPNRAVNKCGHALHALHPAFAKFSFSETVRAVARSLQVHQDPRVLQSMIICKQPSIGGAVPSHNDSTFLYTDPPSAIGFWFALEDCTKSNGCLSFLPGSHRWPKGASLPETSTARPRDSQQVVEQLGLGPARGINKRFVRNDPDNVEMGTGFETLAPNADEEAKWQEEKAIVEECPAGTLVLIHGSVLHKSEKNLSPKCECMRCETADRAQRN